ncbi:hypothetical protein ACIQXW_06160 [Lysinibacillus sp. NPDC097162]
MDSVTTVTAASQVANSSRMVDSIYLLSCFRFLERLKTGGETTKEFRNDD